MNYDEAIARWGAARLDAWKKKQLERSRSSAWRTKEQRAEDAERFATPTDPARVYVDFKFEDEGSSCCDPHATGTVAELRIEERVWSHLGTQERNRVSIEAAEFDFNTVFREVVLAAGGTVTASDSSGAWRDAVMQADLNAEIAGYYDEDHDDEPAAAVASPRTAPTGRIRGRGHW